MIIASICINEAVLFARVKNQQECIVFGGGTGGAVILRVICEMDCGVFIWCLKCTGSRTTLTRNLLADCDVFDGARKLYRSSFSPTRSMLVGCDVFNTAVTMHRSRLIPHASYTRCVSLGLEKVPEPHCCFA